MGNARRGLITGAGRGLGRAMVAQSVSLGHTVVGCSRSRQSVQELTQSFAPPHRFDVVDVASDEAVGRWASSLLEEIGPPDLFLNNAGIINTDMLQSCFGSNASAYPGPEQWAERSVPFLLSLDANDNGRPQTAPA